MFVTRINYILSVRIDEPNLGKKKRLSRTLASLRFFANDADDDPNPSRSRSASLNGEASPRDPLFTKGMCRFTLDLNASMVTLVASFFGIFCCKNLAQEVCVFPI